VYAIGSIILKIFGTECRVYVLVSSKCTVG